MDDLSFGLCNLLNASQVVYLSLISCCRHVHLRSSCLVCSGQCFLINRCECVALIHRY